MKLEEARRQMHEWTQSESLRAHMEAVAACVGAYARRLAPDEVERWAVCALLHDFDYERHPSKEEHPFVGVRHLESLGVDRETLDAILGHADYSGVARQTPLAKTLYACDELAGFIVACVKVRPSGIADLEPKSVKKKLKDKAFAAAVSREDIDRGITDLEPLAGVDLTGHIQICIDALRADSARLGLEPH